MKKLALAILFILIIPLGALAQTSTPSNAGITAMEENANELNAVVGFKDASVANIVSAILTVIFSLLAIIFLGLIVYSGIQWMTAGGNEDMVKKSKANIKNAVIGLFIIALSYTITYFIFNQDWFFVGTSNGAGSSGV